MSWQSRLFPAFLVVVSTSIVCRFTRHYGSIDVMFLLTCLLLYVVRTSILFSATVSLILRLLYLFSAVCNVISDVSYFAPVGYKSREVFLSFCFFCTAYRAATTVTTILHKYIELICEPPCQLINVSPWYTIKSVTHKALIIGALVSKSSFITV
jgi:hypothetical protein